MSDRLSLVNIALVNSQLTKRGIGNLSSLTWNEYNSFLYTEIIILTIWDKIIINSSLKVLALNR